MEEALKVAINGGVSVVLAVVVVFLMRQDATKRSAECKHCAIEAKAWAERERDDKETMRGALEGNTHAITLLVETVRSIGDMIKLSRIG